MRLRSILVSFVSFLLAVLTGCGDKENIRVFAATEDGEMFFSEGGTYEGETMVFSFDHADQTYTVVISPRDETNMDVSLYRGDADSGERIARSIDPVPNGEGSYGACSRLSDAVRSDGFWIQVGTQGSSYTPTEACQALEEQMQRY